MRRLRCSGERRNQWQVPIVLNACGWRDSHLFDGTDALHEVEMTLETKTEPYGAIKCLYVSMFSRSRPLVRNALGSFVIPVDVWACAYRWLYDWKKDDTVLIKIITRREKEYASKQDYICYIRTNGLWVIAIEYDVMVNYL